MNIPEIISGLICIIHIVLSIIGTRRILSTILLDPKKKKINIVLLWLIPFLWYQLVKNILKRTPGSHEIPIKNDISSNVFHESGKGAPCTDIRRN